MKSGIEYVDGMDLHGITEAGLKNFEVPFRIFDKEEKSTQKAVQCDGTNDFSAVAQNIEENGGNIDGIAVYLSDLTYRSGQYEKTVLKEDASRIFNDAIAAADKYNAYIVIVTENIKEAAVIEQLADECTKNIKASNVRIFIENGYTNDNGRFYHNDYSDGRRLIELTDKLNLLVSEDKFGICINVGHANLLSINVRDMVRICDKKTGIVHINDNDGKGDYHQMPYTFTTGRGDLSTAWGNIIGDLSKIGFDGRFVFNVNGTFKRTPAKLHKAMAELLDAMYKEWLESCFKTEEYLSAEGKKIILFGAGRMALNYMENWGNKYPPAFLVDNNSEIQGQERWGIPVKSPAEILNVPKEERNVWICNMYYDSIAAQLDGMGVEYRCYWDHYYM